MSDAPARPLILVSNDDGITAPGIRHLVEIVQALGAEVVVVAPDAPQSGMGHAITIGHALRLTKNPVFGPDVEAYECSGTPADCVKIAKHYVLKDRTPDLVVSGINHGSNASVNVLYSGTMSAAIEAAIEGLPAVGFSLCEYGPNADFSHVAEWVSQVCRHALTHGIPTGTALNVNIPKNSDTPIAGLRLARQARAKWQEEFDRRLDPYQRPYYWLIGSFVNLDHGTDTDEWALAHNYVSVVPCQFDLTAAHGLAHLSQQWQLPLPMATEDASAPQPIAAQDYGVAAPE
ncbi:MULTISPECIES: 5'/3'-nucleotidase SurE [Hymenobacter]|uniref:5'-nucleotidase SurE n=1 Tax=Hymenobacter armeniacus TaxID=2771358 RepID=A0ABR8JMA2_9BACT|nr:MULTISPECIES: 5'/3'-nucleotidase SurE [Hymenobacter]MBD2721129.1 5'/3'-nucleotidase SurE [Hymenobacter armeniacus]MBJ6109264.1 5'/3'-nucleotidase SurE [Hymenobacter sp. BT523]